MQTTANTVPVRRRGRVVGLFMALLLQAGMVWALIAGLDIRDIPKIIDHTTQVFLPKKTVLPPPPPVDPGMQRPENTKPIPLPPLQFDDGERHDGGITPPPVRPVSGPGDRGAVSIMPTHTVPPYPVLDQRLGHEGTVVLRLTISPQGAVVDAAVVRSSGYAGLDLAARDWVMAHWRYQPAVRGGVAVSTVGTVSVTFNLRTAG
jgi:periplasmic protein TonB